MTCRPVNRLACLCSLLLLIACGDDDRGRPGRDTGTADTTGIDTSVPGRDTSVPPGFDPFDPANGCGSSTIETQRLPGSLLIVFDRSGSMDGEVGGSTKWDLGTAGINNVLASVSDDLNAGLWLFSSDGDCGVGTVPDVPVAPLPESRGPIAAALRTTPSGNTPAYAGLLAGYDYLDTLTIEGPKGIVLVSDGGESCDFERREEVMARVESERTAKGRLTFAVGMNFSNNDMSTIAFNGGTARNDTCMPMCTSGSCLTDADCGGAPCALIVEGEPGFCSCENDSQCVGAQTCEPSPIPPFACGVLPALCANRCEGPADCCHYNAAAGDFRAEFEDALGDIARRLLDSCIFDVPESSMFDPSLVNVGVTFEGEDRTVLRRSSDDGMDSWNYTTPENDAIVIQGPICDRLLGGESGTVEIVLGCSTLI